MATPFVLPFAHKSKYYLYDYNTNAILEVDKALFALIKHFDVLGETPEIVPAPTLCSAAREAALTSEEVERTITTVKTAHAKQGLFSGRRPAAMRFPFSADEMRIILSHAICRLILGVTENCNLRCAYCKYSGEYLYSRSHRPKAMSLRTAISAVQFMIERSSYIINHTSEPISVTFYGGEPLLNFPVIRGCVEYVRDDYPEYLARTRFAITSNITVCTAEMLDFLIANRFELTVSLDGPKDLHDRYRRSIRGDGTFDRVMDNLEELKRRDKEYYRTHVSISVVLMPPYNIEAVVEFLDTHDLLREHTCFINFADFKHTTVYDRFDATELRATRMRQLERLGAQLQSRIGDGDEHPGSALAALTGVGLRAVVRRPVAQMPTVLYPNGICVPGAQRTFVDPDGRLHMCERIGEDFAIGDLERGYDVDAILQFIKSYVQVSERSCLHCWAARFCPACFTAATKGPVMDGVAKEVGCESVKVAALNALKQYCELMPEHQEALCHVFPKPEVTPTIEVARRCLRHYKSMQTANSVARSDSA